MNNSRKITFLIKLMAGGGAERVISILSRATADKGYAVSLIITHQSLSDAVLDNVDKRVKVISLPDELVKTKKARLAPQLIMLFARLIGKLGMKRKTEVFKYYSRNYDAVLWLKKYFKSRKKSVVVSFLYDSIFLTLLSANKSNRVIISERGDPQQTKSKTSKSFMQTEFCKADVVAFQSPDAMKWYEENTPVKGKVIFNPVKPDLPEPYIGERKKRIVNFCRIDAQKNLIMLVEAFSKLQKEFPDYELYIYGNSSDDYIDKVNKKIKDCGCDGSVKLLPARQDIHTEIKDYAMFVSSSDFEGMSNSMLEAMAIGLPCICTDCPAGGARAIIKDGENGLLIPVNDSEACCLAMKKLIENPVLAKKLSQNAVSVRKDLSVEKIIKEWMEIIND